jgi:hypothetical protein
MQFCLCVCGDGDPHGDEIPAGDRGWCRKAPRGCSRGRGRGKFSTTGTGTVAYSPTGNSPLPSLAGGKFGEVAEVFLAHWTLVLAAPDAGLERPLWCQSVAQVCRVHRTHRSESGAQRPVCGRFGDPLCA